jgi:hypothetical protein
MSSAECLRFIYLRCYCVRTTFFFTSAALAMANKTLLESGVLTTFTVRIFVFRVPTPFNLVCGYYCFGGKHCLHVQCRMRVIFNETLAPYLVGK